jgi:hypothetical protein
MRKVEKGGGTRVRFVSRLFDTPALLTDKYIPAERVMPAALQNCVFLP